MADQNSPDPLTPVLPPIPDSPLQELVSPTPQTVAAPQASSIEEDMPISEVVALTETKIETPPTSPSPVHLIPAASPEIPVAKSPLFEDPDLIKGPGSS